MTVPILRETPNYGTENRIRSPIHVEITMVVYGHSGWLHIMTKMRTSVVYVLRCWSEITEETDVAAWRFRLENPVSGQQQGFTTVAALTKHLQVVFAPENAKDEADE